MEPTTMTDGDAAVRQALDVLAPAAAPDIDRVLARQQAMQSAPAPARHTLFDRLAMVARPAMVPLAAALVIALLAVTPVRGLAAQMLAIFRVQDVAPITIDNVTHPPDLSRLGDMSPAPRELHLQPIQVNSLSAATSQVGFNVQTPSQLPAGLSNPPTVIAVTSGTTVNFTFKAQKARAYLDSIGHKEIAVPDKFDGATLTLRVPAAASLAYLPPGASLAELQAAASSDRAGGKPDTAAINRLLGSSGIMLIEAKSPELDASGVSADELRDFMLSLPGIPDDTKAQLRSIGDWRNTLPVPVPPGSNLHKVSVNGAPGVTGSNGRAQIVLWVKNGIVYVATGPKADEKTLLALAASVG